MGEVQEELRHIDHASSLVHDDHTATSHHAASRRQRVVINWRIKHRGGETATRRSASLNSLKPAAIFNATTNTINNITQCGSHGNLDKPGVVNVAGQSKHLGTRTFLCTHRAEPFRSIKNDNGDICKRLNIVDYRRFSPKPFDRRIGRTRTRHSALAFDRIDQGGLFATHKCASTQTDFDIKIKVRTKDALSKESSLTGIHDSDFQTLNG